MEENYDYANDFDLKDKIREASLAVVLFAAIWCNKSQEAMKIFFYNLQREFPEIKFILCIIETGTVINPKQANPESKKEFGIREYPTIITFKEGKAWGRIVTWKEADMRDMLSELMRDQKCA